MYLHITFTDGSNPYIKFYYNENPLKSIKRDIRSWIGKFYRQFPSGIWDSAEEYMKAIDHAIEYLLRRI